MRIRKRTVGFVLGFLVTGMLFLLGRFMAKGDETMLAGAAVLYMIGGFFFITLCSILFSELMAKGAGSFVLFPTPAEKIRVLTGRNLYESNPVEIELNNLEIEKMKDRYSPLELELPGLDLLETREDYVEPIIE